MSTAEPVIEVAGLSRRYGARMAVEGVTLNIGAGDVVGLVGANGGGKTTTLRMLAGLLEPSGGSGTVLGTDVLRPERAQRHRIGYMSQPLALYPELTVAENLHFRAEVACGGDSRAAGQVARKYGLGDRLGSRLAELSGGWARRVQFAASVIHQPALLLLDEPTAGLDARTRRDMWGWIAELAALGCGVVVSTHDMHEAEQCPLILHFRDGRVEGPLSPRELIERNRASTLEEAVIAEAGA
jgi:ABC-2 type transport system ATP-binding protein